MTRKSLMMVSGLAATGLVAGALIMIRPALAGNELRVVSWGGAYQEALRKAYFEPFTKSTGIKITEDAYSGESGKIRAMVESKTVSWDLVEVGFDTDALCAANIVERMDWNKLGLDRSKFMGDKNDCGIPFVAAANIVAYDKDKLANGPKTIADLFDMKKFPGKRGLYKSPKSTLEWALIADGVPVKDVYKVLGTPEGVDRAFKKLDTIKRDVVWWSAGAVPPQLLADGQVVMTAAFNGRISDAIKKSGKNFEIMWDASILGWGIWVIPRGSPRIEEAYKFIAFASSPQVQADLTHYIPYGPANKDAIALIDRAILPDLPNAPANMTNALEFDYAFWGERGPDLDKRFAAWLAR
ncbi:ABC transporter substrate-binding protein [Bradyrhizobium sp. LMG 9283]|uniref:ABC transporter substrate-binding protein n=1 Tax=Bradyrhizobium sp. LMG 9283 TaxID=592064 RepID=UPI00388E5B79